MAHALFGPRSPFNADRIGHGAGNWTPLPSFVVYQLDTESISRSSMSTVFGPPGDRASVKPRLLHEGITLFAESASAPACPTAPPSLVTLSAHVSGNEAFARPQSGCRTSLLYGLRHTNPLENRWKGKKEGANHKATSVAQTTSTVLRVTEV